ncbi:MAG TPA: DNA polymerase III subunit delta [Verrucomicrobiae bacterium]|nr:DNA polymerase III subunit delta [Verrucomicrobiae bacterium]
MITLLTGDNSFENERALGKLVAEFDGVPERVDGDTLELKQVPDLLMGATLFANKRLVIIKNLSGNKTLWTGFSDWAHRLSSDVHLVLVEPKPDKRTKTYKDLQKIADIKESKLWGERDFLKAEQWVMSEAGQRGITLDKASARLLVERVGADQWQLSQALEKLAVAGPVSPQVVEALIEANPVENVFLLFEAALAGDGNRIKKMLQILETTEDPYRLLGLLGGQAVQLAVVAVADKPSAQVAGEIGVHPYALSKLAPAARKLGRSGAKKVVAAFAEADEGAKTSAADPWLLIERALVKVACV